MRKIRKRVCITMQPLQDLRRRELADEGLAQESFKEYAVFTMQMLLPLSRILGSFVFDPL